MLKRFFFAALAALALSCPQPANATLTTSTTSVTCTASGGPLTCALPFRFFNNSDLIVTLNGVLKTIGTHYTVACAGCQSGGSVTMLSNPTVGSSLVVTRYVPYLQLFNARSQGPFRPASYEDAYDNLSAQIQQLNAGVCSAALASFPVIANSPILGTGITSDHLRWDFSVANTWTAKQTFTPASGNTDAIAANGFGSGNGVTATGGASGAGLKGIGGATSGTGVWGVATAGNSVGVVGTGQGTGKGVDGTGGATSGTGTTGTGGAPNGIGVQGNGSGTGTGVVANGGGTSGIGVIATAGGTGSAIAVKPSAASKTSVLDFYDESGNILWSFGKSTTNTFFSLSETSVRNGFASDVLASSNGSTSIGATQAVSLLGTGGSVSIAAGFGGTFAVHGGTGGSVAISAGNAGGCSSACDGSPQNGGNLTLSGGTQVDGGTAGTVAIKTDGTARVSIDGLATTLSSTAATTRAGLRNSHTRNITHRSSVAVPDCTGATLNLTVTQFLDSGFATCGTAQTINFPTWQGASGIVQNLPGTPAVGDVVEFTVVSTAASNVTVGGGTGGTISGNAVLNNTRATFHCRLTVVTAASEAATCY